MQEKARSVYQPQFLEPHSNGNHCFFSFLFFSFYFYLFIFLFLFYHSRIVFLLLEICFMSTLSLFLHKWAHIHTVLHLAFFTEISLHLCILYLCCFDSILRHTNFHTLTQDVFMKSENLVTLDFIKKQEPQNAFKCITDIKG